MKWIFLLCNSCKTLNNVLINSHVIILGLIFWGDVQYKKESPDFRSPEVSISVNVSFLEWTILFKWTNVHKTALWDFRYFSKSGMLGICTEAAICRLHIPHNTPCLPPIILHKHCLFFSWSHCNTQEKLKTKIMKSFGRQTRCIMGDIQIANGQFWNWLEQGRVYSIQSLVCSWHHNSLVIILWEKNSTVLTPNMAALLCGCKPRIRSLVTWAEQGENGCFRRLIPSN